MGWRQKAATLLEGVKDREAEGGTEYDDATVKQAVVHTRQDVVLIVSYLDSLNAQVRVIKWLLVAAVFFLAVIADKLK